MAISDAPIARWRPSVLALTTLCVVALLLACMAIRCVVGVVDDAGSRGTWALGTLFYAVAAAVVALLMRGRVDLYRDYVELIRWFGFTTTKVPLSDIVDAGVDGNGLHLKLRSGKSLVGPAIVGQKGLGLKLIGYQNRGDTIAHVLMEAVRAHER